MRAIAVTCPQCGASLRVADSVDRVTCQYCGKEARLQTRSRVFQVPRRLPEQVGAPPVARQQVSRAALAPLVIVPVVVGLGAWSALRVQSRVKAVEDQVARDEAVRKQQLTWASQLPELGDVDGDGRLELVGPVRYIADGDRLHLAAFSLATGAPVWQGERLGTFSELVQADLIVRGPSVLLATDDGRIHGFAAATGARQWTVELGEKVDRVCAGDQPDEALIVAADKTWWTIDARGGKRAARPRKQFGAFELRDGGFARFAALGVEGATDLCLPIGNDAWRGPPGLVSIDSWSGLPSLPGLSVQRLVRRPGGPIVVVASKSPGTAVPMLARLDGKRAAWAREIPEREPLTASADDKHVALTDDAVFALYQAGDRSLRLAAFALADGARRWDVAVATGSRPTSVTGIIAGQDTVLVATSYALYAFDAASGAGRYQLGGL